MVLTNKNKPERLLTEGYPDIIQIINAHIRVTAYLGLSGHSISPIRYTYRRSNPVWKGFLSF